MRTSTHTKSQFAQRLSLSAVFCVLLSLGAQSVSAQQSVKIGYVDMKRLLDNAPQIIEGRARLEQEFRQRDALFRIEEKKLQDLRNKQQKDGLLLSKADADALAKEIETLARSVKRMSDRMRSELNLRSEEELNKRWPEIQDAVVQYARANNFDLIVQEPVLYAAPRIDITEVVLEGLRKTHKTANQQP